MEPVRVAATSRQADEWALVLTAVAIPTAVEPVADGWAVLAAPDDAVRARAALTAYDDERRDERPPDPIAAGPYPWMSGVALGLLVFWLYGISGDARARSAWFEHGSAAAGRIQEGELWRAVTALTLHVDVVHATGNAVALAVLAPPVVQRFGAGAALLFLLLAGVIGNTAAALFHDARHLAVGASTAAFGAVGILIALRLLPTEAPTSRKRWTAPVAGLVLLVTLGAAREADLAAHAFGLAAGVVVGAAGALALRDRPRAAVQWVLGGLAAITVAVCWHIALRG